MSSQVPIEATKKSHQQQHLHLNEHNKKLSKINTCKGLQRKLEQKVERARKNFQQNEKLNQVENDIVSFDRKFVLFSVDLLVCVLPLLPCTHTIHLSLLYSRVHFLDTCRHCVCAVCCVCSRGRLENWKVLFIICLNREDVSDDDVKEKEARQLGEADRRMGSFMTSPEPYSIILSITFLLYAPLTTSPYLCCAPTQYPSTRHFITPTRWKKGLQETYNDSNQSTAVST